MVLQWIFKSKENLDTGEVYFKCGHSGILFYSEWTFCKGKYNLNKHLGNGLIKNQEGREASLNDIADPAVSCLAKNI